MAQPDNRREFILKAASTASVIALGSSLAACGGSYPTPSQFNYGVASGDPLSDRVILWTHAKIEASDETVGLAWLVATDAGFTQVVKSGRLEASAATGFTVKVDVIGLAAGTTYFYRFIDDANVVSTTGTTRTLPAAGVASVKFAVFSCALYSCLLYTSDAADE